MLISVKNPCNPGGQGTQKIFGIRLELVNEFLHLGYTSGIFSSPLLWRSWLRSLKDCSRMARSDLILNMSFLETWVSAFAENQTASRRGTRHLMAPRVCTKQRGRQAMHLPEQQFAQS